MRRSKDRPDTKAAAASGPSVLDNLARLALLRARRRQERGTPAPPAAARDRRRGART
jgi:hypothetical protein